MIHVGLLAGGDAAADGAEHALVKHLEQHQPRARVQRLLHGGAVRLLVDAGQASRLPASVFPHRCGYPAGQRHAQRVLALRQWRGAHARVQASQSALLRLQRPGRRAAVRCRAAVGVGPPRG